MDFAPASAANSGEAAAEIHKGRQSLMRLFFRASRSEALFHLGRAKEIGNKDYVHFFDTRQRNEPKKTCIGGDPPMYPPISRANAASRLLSTRGCYQVQRLNCLVGKRRGKSENSRRGVTFNSMLTAPNAGAAGVQRSQFPQNFII